MPAECGRDAVEEVPHKGHEGRRRLALAHLGQRVLVHRARRRGIPLRCRGLRAEVALPWARQRLLQVAAVALLLDVRLHSVLARLNNGRLVWACMRVHRMCSVHCIVDVAG